MTHPAPPIISPEGVKQLLTDRDVIVADVRGGADARKRYHAGHLSGAVFFDLDADLSNHEIEPARGGRHPLPSPETFGKLLGTAGITPTTKVLVYDDKSGANAAARFWWMMRAAGHSAVYVIDGGLAALVAAGLPVTEGQEERSRTAATYPVSDWKLPQADIDTVDKLRTSGEFLVIDVRERYRYLGESEPIDLVAGHIPGALNAPYLDNLDSNGRFKSPAALRQQYLAILGERPVHKVILHCGSGVTACHTLLALEHAGLPGASLYVGSWSQWSRRNKPIARGPEPAPPNV